VRRLVVHLGPPKTATTFIQRGLFDHSVLLARHGILLPHSARLEFEPRAVSHHHLAWELSGSPRFRARIGGWDAVRAEVEASDAEIVVLSSEELGRALNQPGFAAALEMQLRSFDRRITLVYTVRDQLSSLNSMYAQQVKIFEAMPDFSEFARGALARGELDVDALLRRWDKDGIDLVAIPFSDLASTDPFAAFVEAAGLEVPAGELELRAEPVNITLGPIAVEAMRLLRSYLVALDPGATDDDDAVRRLHRKAAQAASAAGWCTEPFWGWPPALAAEVADAVRASNDSLARRHWGGAWPMPLPVDRPQATAELITLEPDELMRVHRFVIGMTRRYVSVRTRGRTGVAAVPTGY
jgi:hypothetical protein